MLPDDLDTVQIDVAPGFWRYQLERRTLFSIASSGFQRAKLELLRLEPLMAGISTISAPLPFCCQIESFYWPKIWCRIFCGCPQFCSHLPHWLWVTIITWNWGRFVVDWSTVESRTSRKLSCERIFSSPIIIAFIYRKLYVDLFKKEIIFPRIHIKIFGVLGSKLIKNHLISGVSKLFSNPWIPLAI